MRKSPKVPPAAPTPVNLQRRFFLGTAATVGAGVSVGLSAATPAEPRESSQPELTRLEFSVNGVTHALNVDTRTTLLDALRDHLQLTGSKKGCDRGQCGACTVIADGRRINACLSLAVMHAGAHITTVEGLAVEGRPGALQAAFLERDAFQCGYCTPGQLCSATALLQEARAGQLSAISTVSAATAPLALSDAEIRERMSGNICRCGAYPNIVAAIRDVAQQAS